eukprot:127623_1
MITSRIFPIICWIISPIVIADWPGWAASPSIQNGFSILSGFSGCKLDIGYGAQTTGPSGAPYCCADHSLYNSEEMDVFWNCAGPGSIWNIDGTRLYTDKKRTGKCEFFNYGTRYYLEDDWDEGEGHQIQSDERNAKVDPSNGDAIIYIDDGDDHFLRYINDNDKVNNK